MEPLFHLLLPPLILSALFPKLKKKYLLYLIPFTFIMDFDLFLPVAHRFFFHNLFFIIIATTIIYFIWNKKAAIITAFYTLSHLILDLQKPGVAFFFPLIKKTLYITTEIIDSPFNWHFKVGTMSLTKYLTITDIHSYYLTTSGTQLILISIIAILIIKKLKNRNVPN